MPTITIPLSDEHLSQLQARAARRGVTPEELVRTAVEEMLARPDSEDAEQTDFDQMIEYVLKKNTELYRRLA